MAHRTPTRGFTLLELVVCIGIVAILASIGWSSYMHVVHRVRRTDAKLALLKIQHSQEVFYAQHNRYAASLAPGGLALSSRSDAGDYELSLAPGADNQHYTATAVASASGRQLRDDACHSLSVDAEGTRSS
ncbi:MAG: type IV pilin protein, partial [Steroidobacteraceae bacterium]